MNLDSTKKKQMIMRVVIYLFGREWTGQTACICLWTCCDQTVDPSASVTNSVPHRRGIFEYPDIEAGDSSICEK